MFNDAKASNTTEILLDGSDRWTMGPSLNEVRVAPGVCNFHDQYQLIAGGFGGSKSYLQTTEYLSSDGRFVYGPTMNASRSGPCAVVSPYNDMWVLGGGANGMQNNANAERLDMREGKWHYVLEDARFERRCFASAFCGNHLVLYGGWVAREWHIPSLCTVDIRMHKVLKWVDLPSLSCGGSDVQGKPVIPYQFVNGCFLI